MGRGLRAECGQGLDPLEFHQDLIGGEFDIAFGGSERVLRGKICAGMGLVGQGKEEHPNAHQAEHNPFSFHLSVSFPFSHLHFWVDQTSVPRHSALFPTPFLPPAPRVVDVDLQLKGNVFPRYGIQGDAFGDVLHFLSAKADQNEMANSSWDIAEPVVH